MRQALAITLMNLQTLPARWGVSAVVVVCMAGVAGVMVSMLAMAQGFQNTFERSGRADRVVVLATGETSEGASSITRDQLPLILNAQGLARRADGKPAASVERFTIAPMPLRGAEANLIVRGVSEQVQAVRPEVRIVEGRMFRSGLRELVVGVGAQRQFDALPLGAEVELSGVAWTVVGVFESGGGSLESEAWGEVEVVMNAYNQVAYSSVTARLESEASFGAYQDAITGNPGLSHTPQREPEYFESQGGILAALMRGVGYAVAAIMATGALFAALNTMYASVEARTVEIGTLRALGFGGAAVVVSVLVESVLLCGAGSLVGGAMAWLLFNGYTVSTLGGNLSQVAFAFSVTAPMLLRGVVWASMIGLLGGFAPALRAARMPLADALRAV